MSSGFEIDGPLLGRFVTGDCSEEERAAVEAWLAEDPSRRRRLEELQWAWETSERPIPKQDSAAAWQRMRTRLDAEREAPGNGAGRSDRRRRRSDAARPRSPLVPTLRVGSVVALAVVITLFAIRMEWVSVPLPEDAPLPVEKVFATAQGERATVLLTDGTRVRLNAASRLTVAPGFGLDERSVTLDGEAFFEVSSDSLRPFRVHTAAAAVRVVGTSFNVRSRTAEATQVAVAEGRVAVRSQRPEEHNTVMLRRQDVARVEIGAGTFVSHDVDLYPYLAWTEGQLVFADAPFDEVARELERWYDLEVIARMPASAVRPFNGEFGDEALDEILDIIASTLHLEYEREEHRVTFFEAGAEAAS